MSELRSECCEASVNKLTLDGYEMHNCEYRCTNCWGLCNTKSPEAEKMFYCPKCKRWTVNKHDH